jgi:ubiquinone/menaquinone biosynthesis C-methylase UbiE
MFPSPFSASDHVRNEGEDSMGRFETTAETYSLYREPYPRAFFAEAAARLGLKGGERLIDLGTGPGVLALGFRPYVGSVLGVDPEPNMLAAARAAADAAGTELPLLAGRAEDLPEGIGPFDLVTIGRALHWMDPEATSAVLDRILAADGTILVCGSSPAKDGSNPWQATFDAIVHSWTPSAREVRGWQSVYERWFDGTPFAEIEEIRHVFTAPVTPAMLFSRVLTRSSTSPAVLEDRVDACRDELMAALSPFFPDGAREETLAVRATVIRRR